MSKGVEEIDVWEVDLNEQDHVLAMYMLNNHYGEFEEDMLRSIVQEIQEAEELSIDCSGLDSKKIESFLSELETDSLQEEMFCSTIIFETENQKKKFNELRKKFKTTAKLAEMAETKLQQWTE